MPVVRLAYRPLATWPRVTWLAVTAMLFSILPFHIVSPIVGFSLGVAALVRIRHSRGRYDGYFPAIYGIAVSGLVLLSCAGPRSRGHPRVSRVVARPLNVRSFRLVRRTQPT